MSGSKVTPLRTYGRLTNPDGSKFWVVVTTDPNGFNDMVYLTTLAQEYKLNLGESPFFSDRGIPARASVMQQIAPDYNMYLTQQRYAAYFASLITIKTSDNPPTYDVNVITKQGATLTFSVIPV